jgi:cellulose synthase operon protein C
MLTLLFTNLDALRLALVSGAVPAEMTGSRARAGLDSHGRIWLQIETTLPRETSTALTRLGVSIIGGEADIELSPIGCWLELFPLAPATVAPQPGARVLLRLPVQRCAHVVAQIKQLSPASQIKFRVSEFSADALLLAEGCPIFTMLAGGDGTAFLEQSPRVWVEAGFEHPLAGLVQPPAGQMVVICAPGRWVWLTDEPFEPEITQFAIPEARPRLTAAGDLGRIEVPLRLMESRSAEAPELWILRDRPIEQLRELAQQSGQAFLQRFRWALVESDGESMVLLWAIPSKSGPPAPAVTGVGFRAYAKMPNLFLPCGFRLDPTLRRDALRRLWNDEGRDLTLLLPSSERGFVSVTVSESAFEPLEYAVDFAVEFPSQPLAKLEPAPPMSWEPFTVELPPKPVTLPPIKLPSRRPKTKTAMKKRAGLLKRIQNWLRRPAHVPSREDLDTSIGQGLPDRSPPPPPEATGRLTHLLARRGKLEARFFEAMRLSDPQEQAALLPELAALNSQLGHLTDSAACWIAALWQRPAPPRYWLWGWLQAEKKLSRMSIDEDQIGPLLESTPTPATIRTLAATVYWLASRDPPSPALIESAGSIRTHLETHENWLPLRAAWMAQLALTRAAGGDMLALARTRDRLVERLFHHGLSIELDLPSFMRFAERSASERFPPVRDWLPRLRDSIHRWIDGHVRTRPVNYCRAGPDGCPDADGTGTKALADLMLAWGLARLGEATSARHLAQPARELLSGLEDPVLEFLGRAFDARIRMAHEGKPAAGPLPADLLDELERYVPTMSDDRPALIRYRIDSLRQHSRILEPTELINAFRVAAPLPFQAEWLKTVDAPESLGPAVARLLNSRDAGPRAEELLGTALALAPRLGEAFARQLLTRFAPVAERIGDPLPRLLLTGKALTVSALFDLRETGREMVERLRKMVIAEASSFPNLAAPFQAPHGNRRHGPDDLQRLEELPGQCLRAVRRLGQSAELGTLTLQLVGWILRGEPLVQLREVQPHTWLPALRALLHVFGGHYDDRNDESAALVQDEARQVLLYSDVPANEKGPLAEAYVAALGCAPIRVAQGRIEEMLRDLAGPHDIRETNSHFALGPLRLIDTIVRSVVADQFVLGPAVRRWLDDDEFQARKRMQQDLESAQGNLRDLGI